MAGFDFYERRGNMDKDNLFFGGLAVTNGTITAAYIADSFVDATVKNIRLENNIIKGYIYKPNSGSSLIKKDRFRDKGSLDFVVIDNKGFFDLNDVDGFEFFATNINYVWMPYIRNSLGRQAFQNTKWIKRAYFPYVFSLGQRTFWNAYGAGKMRIYAPTCNNVVSQTFLPSNNPVTNRFNQAVLYLSGSIWSSANVNSNVSLASFVNSGGSVVLIQDFTRPSVPSNVVISNVTATTFDITFNASTFTNGFGWYEIFCETDDNPVSWYFHHQEILTTTATITGLTSGKYYQVKVRAADEYMNLSPFTNSQSITML